MPQKKSKFHYNGPVYRFDEWIGDWGGDTWAPSEAKALSNLSYRYKTEHNLKPGAAIVLDADYLYETTALNEEDEVEEEKYHQITLEEYYEQIHSNKA